MSEKEVRAIKLVKNYMWWSMGAGLVPIPVLDLAAISGVQLKMIHEISKVYEIPFEKSRVQAVIGSLMGFVIPHTLAGGMIASTLKAIPVLGTFAGFPTQVLMSGGAAWALGKVFIQHFESGGTFLNFNASEVREYFKASFEEGSRMAAAMGSAAKPDAAPEGSSSTPA